MFTLKQNFIVWLTRTLILFFWLGILFLYLLLPFFSSLWYKDNVLNILIWAGTIDPQAINIFEKQTGISVNIAYVETNEELFVKLYTTGGKGYDLIMPSDYVVQKLIEHNLIKPLEKDKLTFWHRLEPRLLNHYFDPGNVYSVPWFWAIYGLGIDKTFFKDKEIPTSWSLLFSYPLNGAKVAMSSDMREALLMAAQYLFKSIENLDQEKYERIRQELIKQKKRVEAYIDADVRSNYLLMTQVCPIAIAASPFLISAMLENKNIEFIVPQEGSFILIDSFAISRNSQKDDIIYTFLNFFYQPENVLLHYQNMPLVPATKDWKDILEKENEAISSIITAHLNNKIPLQFFKNVIPDAIANDIWLSLKTA